jgi:hypothetical protein
MAHYKPNRHQPVLPRCVFRTCVINHFGILADCFGDVTASWRPMVEMSGISR